MFSPFLFSISWGTSPLLIESEILMQPGPESGVVHVSEEVLGGGHGQQEGCQELLEGGLH